MRVLTAAIAASLLLLPACSSDTAKPAGATPQKVMETAADKLDATSGVELLLTSAGLPDQGNGFVLVGGEGTAVKPDAFEGTLQIKALGLSTSAQVVATGGKVWIKNDLLGPGFKKIEPAQYGVPDPGALLAADGGVSDLIAETTQLDEGDTVRGGEDNKDVLTEYTGVLTGSQIQKVLGMGAGDFKARYEVDSEGYLRTVELTGAFYAGEPDATYTVSLKKYDVSKEITAP
ncbi:LppX_LprAFG lipoprotein [Nocardioides jiangxiensis]|uniref:LppX_LprAFG lipoprotein n=1 Tax=Nocardioides jiangxiensis TaxID=3064524 RepID=A0ABT9B3M3_9ACTN|nr:LppX_LprAFG lipoprotein [Nocardioides sp. WY-20]MDO7869449.1 LppX_LprAFG lipoprotein [Nocardioides sp. WY-20]